MERAAIVDRGQPDNESGKHECDTYLAEDSSISPDEAPIAMRTPISWVRCVTAYEILFEVKLQFLPQFGLLIGRCHRSLRIQGITSPPDRMD
jgi:hypothetical protein